MEKVMERPVQNLVDREAVLFLRGLVPADHGASLIEYDRGRDQHVEGVATDLRSYGAGYRHGAYRSSTGSKEYAPVPVRSRIP
ncbi:hypothetical protein GCM10022232_64540 [Streptomyces plumbiresistens]|uniref:Uncharacterized protein n=1 Tax=Streptomyces plumbiresistens TaxID=511811 RepID=A0ABP7SLG4_9ACTN